ncbi:MAG: BadF/BadG/BcrA/BcrD ATPase family protein [Deinococcus sp.]
MSGTEGGGSAYAVGIDLGGTRARALLPRARGGLGRGEAGGGNLRQVGPGAVVSSLLAATTAAFAAAGLPASPSSCAVHAGIAGLATPEDHATLAQVRHPFARFSAESDATLALGAHFAGESGVLLVVGTGCVALARAEEGHLCRRLGWGFPLEAGGGADLGLQALRLGLRDWEQGEDSFLARSLAADFASPRAVMEWAKGLASAGFGRYAPLLFEAAGRGEEWARHAVDTWAGWCADAVAGLQRQAGVTRWGAHGGLAVRLPLTLRPTLPQQARYTPLAWAARIARQGRP